MLPSFWITFTDGTAGACQGFDERDAVEIASHVTSKGVASIKRLPHLASPVIWAFEHPLLGREPTFCYRPKQCSEAGRCTATRACND